MWEMGEQLSSKATDNCASNQAKIGSGLVSVRASGSLTRTPCQLAEIEANGSAECRANYQWFERTCVDCVGPYRQRSMIVDTCLPRDEWVHGLCVQRGREQNCEDQARN